jgi:lipid A 3-O-deacylase
MAWIRLVIMGTVFAGISTLALAQEGYPPMPAYDYPYYPLEIRGGIFAHSADQGPYGVEFTRIEDFNAELLFQSPDLDLFRWLGSPRPMIGATLNFGGRESMAYAGLAWKANLFDSPFFVEGTFGGAVHNGALRNPPEGMRDLGCPVLFHESVSLGYDLSKQASIMMTAEHASHANLCAPENRGLTNIGIRLGFRF